jgi:HK97 family phage portal protein
VSSLFGKLRAARSTPGAESPIPYVGSGNGILALGGNQLADSDPQGYMRAYGSSGTVYAIVSMLARQTAKKDWHLYRSAPQDGRRRYTTADRGSDQRVEVIRHQALDIWHKPNPFMSGFQLRELTQTYLDLTGEGYLVLGRDPRANFPMSMWSARPDRMTPIPSREEYLAGWVYTGPSGEQIPLQRNEVIQLKYPNPFDPYRGLGPIQSILVDIDAAKYSASWNRNFFLNSATPGGVIQMDKRLSDEEWAEFTNRWREGHRGMGAAHRVAILEQGAVWVPNSHSIKDMDFANLRGVSRDVIREAFSMHKAILGTTDDVNRANSQTAQEHFESFLITDRLDRWKDTLNCQFLPLFGATGEGVELDYEDPVTGNREADALELFNKARAAELLVQAGYDPTDVLETCGLPDMDVAEKATQAPALPPAWVPAVAPGAPEPGADGEQADTGSAEDGTSAAAQNGLRFEFAAAMRWEAVAEDDKDTCDACAANDGHLYRNRQDAYEDYPDGANYVRCVGAKYGNKCRCKVVKRGSSDSADAEWEQIMRSWEAAR